MNYNRPIIITLLALLPLFSVIARAGDDNQFIPVNPTKPNGLPNSTYPDLRSAIDRRMDKLNALSGSLDEMTADAKKAQIQLQEIERKKGGATVTVAKNYPVVPYDPNHPNVQKQKKTSFNIKANAKTLAGRFARGANAAALAYAVYDILGDGIDWVLDPANNQVVYSSPKHTNCDDASRDFINEKKSKSKNPDLIKLKSVTPYSVRKNNKPTSACYISYLDGTMNKTDTVFLDDDNTLDLETIANHVINNEDNSTTNVITNNYYNTVNETIIEQVNSGQHDSDIKTALESLDESNESNDESSLDSSSTTTQPQPDSKEETNKDEENSNEENKPFELPAFCKWATKVCDWIDWTQEEPPAPQEPQTVSKPTLSELGIDDDRFSEKVNFDGQCPSGDFEFTVRGVYYSKPIPYHHFCDLLVQLKPWLLAFVYLSTAYFVVSNL